MAWRRGESRCSDTRRRAHTLFARQVHFLDRKIPMPFEDFKPPLLFLLIGFLIRIKLLDDSRRIETVIRDGCILEDDRDSIVPAAILGSVQTRLGSVHFQDSSQFDFLLQYGIVVLLEEGDEFIRVSPFCFVVVLDDIRFVGTILTCLRGHFWLSRSQPAPSHRQAHCENQRHHTQLCRLNLLHFQFLLSAGVFAFVVSLNALPKFSALCCGLWSSL